MNRRIVAGLLVIAPTACGTVATSGQPSATLPPCQAFDPPPLNVGAEIQHLKTSASVVQVTNREVVLRATSRTTYASAPRGDLAAIGRFGLRTGEVFTLSFDGRALSDGSYPINFMNR